MHLGVDDLAQVNLVLWYAMLTVLTLTLGYNPIATHHTQVLRTCQKFAKQLAAWKKVTNTSASRT